MKTKPDPTRRMLLGAVFAARFASHAPSVAASAARVAPAAAGASAEGPVFCHLSDFAIAGGRYHGLAEVRGNIRVGEVLHLVREPANPHDPFAVAVHRASGLKLGYVPRDLSEVAASLLDAGIPTLAEAVGTLFIGQLDPMTEALLHFTSFVNGDPHLRLLADDVLLAEKIERDCAAAFAEVEAKMAAAEASARQSPTGPGHG